MSKRKTFAEITAEAKAAQAIYRPSDAPPGFRNDGNLVTPDGRVYSLIDDNLSTERADELLQAGALVVVDDCGCKGGCEVEWILSEQARTLAAPDKPQPNKKSLLGFIEEWRSTDDEKLVYFGGPGLKWRR